MNRGFSENLNDRHLFQIVRTDAKAPRRRANWSGTPCRRRRPERNRPTFRQPTVHHFARMPAGKSLEKREKIPPARSPPRPLSVRLSGN
jgi:hypothetical protein